MIYNITAYYDTDSKQFFIDKQDVVLRYNNIIAKYKYYKNKYTINNKVFLNFTNDIAK